MVVRDLLAQLSGSERNRLSNRVQTTLLAGEILRHSITEPDAASETVDGLHDHLTTMIEDLEALRAMLLRPAFR
jgi:hypothetical protein